MAYRLFILTTDDCNTIDRPKYLALSSRGKDNNIPIESKQRAPPLFPYKCTQGWIGVSQRIKCLICPSYVMYTHHSSIIMYHCWTLTFNYFYFLTELSWQVQLIFLKVAVETVFKSTFLVYRIIIIWNSWQ